MTTVFKDLNEGLKEVDAFLSGETSIYQVSVPKDVDVKAARARLNMTPPQRDADELVNVQSCPTAPCSALRSSIIMMMLMVTTMRTMTTTAMAATAMQAMMTTITPLKNRREGAG